MGVNFYQQFPEPGSGRDITRIHISAFEIQKQNLNPRDPNHIQKGGLKSTWSFCGFEDLQESLSHAWEPYGSIQGRLSELIATSKEKFEKVKSGIESIKDLKSGYLNAGNTESAKFKVDTPLVYTGSQRRQITFTFVLQEYNNVYGDVLEPIHEFRRLSCASIEGESVDVIKFPAIFTINSVPQSFISFSDAALTDVQITWGAGAHYKGGNPRRAELTLTFMDIRPLYTSSFGDTAGNIVTTLPPQRINNTKRGL